MSEKVLFIVVAISGFISLAAAAKLPSYIKTCKLNDPELNKCILKNGREALPQVVKGDRQYMLPPLDPFSISEVKIEHGRPPAGLTVVLKDVVMNGLKSIEFKEADANLKKENGVVKTSFWIPRIEVISKYEMRGQILVLPITGRGDCNITMEGNTMNQLVEYQLITKADGLQYMNVTRIDMKFTPRRVYFKFDNLFNGDKFLGNSMNTFLNENWKEVSEELTPNVIGVIKMIVNSLAGGLSSSFPFKDIFPE